MPPSSASLLATRGGSWLWSPTSTNARLFSSGAAQVGCGTSEVRCGTEQGRGSRHVTRRRQLLPLVRCSPNLLKQSTTKQTCMQALHAHPATRAV